LFATDRLLLCHVAAPIRALVGKYVQIPPAPPEPALPPGDAPPVDLRERSPRPREQIALKKLAPEPLHRIPLLGDLHPLRDDADSHLLAERGHRSDDALTNLRLMHAANERYVE